MKRVEKEMNNDGIIYRLMENNTLIVSIYPITRYIDTIETFNIVKCRRLLNGLQDLSSNIPTNIVTSLEVLIIETLLNL